MNFTLAWARTFPPSESSGGTINLIERRSRYWIEAHPGRKDHQLFERGTQTAWSWAQQCQFVRWFTDGERRYAQHLWQLASVYLKTKEYHPAFGQRKVWPEGWEVAMKVKGSQGNRRVEWVKPEHPFTAVSLPSEVHANYNEAHNSAIRRRCSADRRRQNLDAKTVEG